MFVYELLLIIGTLLELGDLRGGNTNGSILNIDEIRSEVINL